MDKKKVFAYAILIIFFGSTLAAAFIQTLSQGGTQNQPNLKLPEKFKNSEYTVTEESAILSSGATLLKYSFTSGCLECEDNKAMLRNFAETSPDVFLSFEESTTHILSIKSSRSSSLLTSQNITEEKITSTYCQATNIASDRCLFSQV